MLGKVGCVHTCVAHHVFVHSDNQILFEWLQYLEEFLDSLHLNARYPVASSTTTATSTATTTTTISGTQQQSQQQQQHTEEKRDRVGGLLSSLFSRSDRDRDRDAAPATVPADSSLRALVPALFAMLDPFM